MNLFSLFKKNNASLPSKEWIPQNIYIGQTGLVLSPTYIIPSFQSIFELATSVPEMGALIQYASNNVAKLPIKIYDKKGIEVTQSDFLDLLNDKIYNSTLKGTIKILAEGIILTGNAYLNVERIGKSINQIFNINPVYTKILTNNTDQKGDYNNRFDFRLDEIQGFAFINNMVQFKMPANEVLHIKDESINEPTMHNYGKSRLIAGIRAITSLSAAYDIKVTAYQKRGAMVVISPKQPNDIAAATLTALDPAEKKELANEFHSLYGFGDGQSPVIITNRAIEAKEIPFNLQGLQLKELTEADFRTLCRIIGGISPNSLGDTEGSTYNNLKTYRKENYDNVLIPLHELIVDGLNKHFANDLKGLQLKGYYDEINAMQEDEELKASTYNKWNEYYSKLYEAGLITKNEWLQGLGEPERPDKSFNELKSNNNDTI